MEDKVVQTGTDSNLWRTVFLAMVLAGMTLIISLSIFFYIRTREPLWDNRSGVSRLVVVNQSSSKKFGSETFTMFGSDEITLTGDSIADETTLFVGDGGILIIEITGISRGETTGSVGVYGSKVIVTRKGTPGVTPLDSTGTQLTPDEVQLSPILGSDGDILVKINGSKVELRGQWDTVTNPTRNYAIKIDVLGWYP
jgi:hypothetical protein